MIGKHRAKELIGKKKKEDRKKEKMNSYKVMYQSKTKTN